MTQLVVFLSPYIATYGYFILAGMLILEGAGLPVPGETVLLIVAAFASHSTLSIEIVIAVGAVSAVAGDSIGYTLGRRHGPRVLRRLHGDGTGMEKSQAFFRRHGPKALIVARFIPVIRVFTAVVAGINQMPTRLFILYDILGAIIWATVIGLLGYVFGNNLERLDHILQRIGWSLLLAVLVIAGSIWLIRRWSRQESRVRARLLRISHRLRLPQFFAWLRYRFNPAGGATFVVTISFGLVVISGWLFGGITQDVLAREEFALYDAGVAVWFLLNVTAESQEFFLLIGQLASMDIIFIGTALVAILLLWQKRWRRLIALWISVAGGSLLNLLLTHFVQRRPPSFPATLVPGRTFSFPADEPMHAVLLYGFIAYLIVRGVPKWGWQVTTALGTITLLVLIGISQMALGTHYLSDVVAGLMAGIFWLGTTILLSELIAPAETEKNPGF
ncbi:MAG: bifunctional DedA family/phosphatase PAP2 family protein [Ardenticatenales bacterium]|nr:bifunctional DedA family/phosphatase PAP2 family protein [Ardenticatenales bacterium]